MTLDPTTLREIARVMRGTFADEIPASPQQHGAFNATITWALWCEQQAAQIDAALPKEDS